MSFEAHVAAVDAAVAQLNQAGAALSQAASEAGDAVPLVIGATGSNPSDGPALEALASIQAVTDEGNGAILAATNGVAHAIEKLQEYRAAWAGNA